MDRANGASRGGRTGRCRRRSACSCRKQRDDRRRGRARTRSPRRTCRSGRASGRGGRSRRNPRRLCEPVISYWDSHLLRVVPQLLHQYEFATIWTNVFMSFNFVGAHCTVASGGRFRDFLPLPVIPGRRITAIGSRLPLIKASGRMLSCRSPKLCGEMLLCLGAGGERS